MRGTVNGTPFQGRLSVYGGVTYLGLRREIRDAAGIADGDIVEVVLELDDAHVRSSCRPSSTPRSRPMRARPSTRSRSRTAASTRRGSARRSDPRRGCVAPSAPSRCCARASATPERKRAAQRDARQRIVPRLAALDRAVARPVGRAVAERERPARAARPELGGEAVVDVGHDLALGDREAVAIVHAPARVDRDVRPRRLDADRELAVVALDRLAEQRARDALAVGGDPDDDRAVRAAASSVTSCRSSAPPSAPGVPRPGRRPPHARTRPCRCDRSSCGPRRERRSSPRSCPRRRCGP